MSSAGIIPFDLDERFDVAHKLRVGVRLTPDEVDIARGFIVALRKIREQRGVDRHTQALCNVALAPFDDR